MKNSIIEKIEERTHHSKVELSQSGLLRELFDDVSSEWNRSTIDEKLEALEILVKQKDENILKLILGMMTTYNEARSTNHIEPIHLVVTLSKLLEELLKKKCP